MKIVTVVGARPQFIKAGAVQRAIQSFNRSPLSRKKGRTGKIKEVWVHTGQHYDHRMNRIFFEELRLPEPDHHLEVGSGSHGQQTALMLERIEAVLEKERPEAVMVYGDTNSTLAGALAAAKLHIPVVHVEAGLRSYNRRMPEEINRLLTDHLSRVLFCPTPQAVRNLLQEGIRDGKETVVNEVGDVMYDSVLHYTQRAGKGSSILRKLDLAPESDLRSPNYYLVTLHRAENTDDLKRLMSVLRVLHRLGREIPVLFPIHPRTRKVMQQQGLFRKPLNIRFMEPLSYLDMLRLIRNARAVLTDSGGVQKEAYWLGVPCITLREETEWVETVRSGWNILAGTGPEKILEAVNTLKRKRLSRRREEIFGDGTASERIVKTLVTYFG